MRTAFYTGVVAACAMAFATDARAAFVSYSTDLNGIYIHPELGEEVADEFLVSFNKVSFLTLPRFDAALGSLLGVQLALESSFTARITGSAADVESESFFPFLFSSNDTSLSARMNAGMEVNVFDPGFNVIMNRTVADDCSRFEEAIISGPDNDNVFCFIESQQQDTFNWEFPVWNLPLTDFIGLDPLNLYAQTTGEAFGACDSDDDGDRCTINPLVFWTGAVTVTYEYLLPDPGGGGGPGGGNGGGGVPVPEPATFGMLAAGLALLVLQRRRTRAARQPAS